MNRSHFNTFQRLSTREIVRECIDHRRRRIRGTGLWSDIPCHYYQSFKLFNTWNQKSDPEYTNAHGAIFNFGFSPDGSKILASTDYNSMLLFDAHNRRLIETHKQAHEKCVNYAQFVSDCVAASCGDDATVRLWDIRKFTQSPLAILYGHSRWVKNVDHVNGKIISSSFDGKILCHEINRGNLDHSPPGQMLAFDQNILRTSLHQGANKLVWSSKIGYLVVVHDLNLETLADDLRGFDPSVQLLIMAIGRDALPNYPDFSHLTNPKRARNRVEIITDFHPENDCEKVWSLQFDPSGEGLLTRNYSKNFVEYTSYHDVGEELSEEDIAAAAGAAVADNDSDSSSEDGAAPFAGVLKRLMFYKKEPQLRKGYIKEPSFSCDGRVIASPYVDRIRLLAFDNKCSRLDEVMARKVPGEVRASAQELEVIKEYPVKGEGYVGAVLATQFAPHDPTLLVAGTDGGQVAFLQVAL